ncbi:hypothetical protein [Roseovarius sp. D0-M9]|uniref:hypothetical protein n=1 Tax=Roseovarius sp. D0-M9 TaxID=3127117 RepID=UPI00300FBBBE
MIEDDPFFYWRIATEISVENAAILMVGGDPEETDAVHIGPFPEDYAYEKRTTGHKGFQSALNALTGAILSGEIPVQIRYQPKSDKDSAVCQTLELGSGKNEHHAKFLSFGNGHLRIGVGTLSFKAEPDWAASMIKVSELRGWLQSKGMDQSVFYSSPVSDTRPFMSPDHEHFAPELDLAMTAWEALKDTPIRNKGSKSVIEPWLFANTDKWRGEGKVAKTTIKRIAMVVNWRKAGAPKSGG